MGRSLEEAGAIAFLPLEAAVAQAQWLVEGGWAAPSRLPLSTAANSQAWLDTEPGASRWGQALTDYPPAEGLEGVVASAITEKKVWLLFMSCVEKSL